MEKIKTYGVTEQESDRSELGLLAEELRLSGYTTLDSGFDARSLDEFSSRFSECYRNYLGYWGERDVDVKNSGENGVIRVIPYWDEKFFEILFCEKLLELVEIVLGQYFIVNQVNGLVNPKNGGQYSQNPYHRDLPYRHLTFSRCIALNALFALDDFTIENGATKLIPGSHRVEKFPSDEIVVKAEKRICVKRGSFIILDCMVYHAGSTNFSSSDRRAINHVFTIPSLRQQIHLASIFGPNFNLKEAHRRILGYGLNEHNSFESWFGKQSV